MKRRKILKLSAGALVALPACSGKKNAQVAEGGKKTVTTGVTPPTQPVKLGANTQYRPPAYVNQGLSNPNMNLPSQFGGQTVTYSRGLSNQPYVAMTFDDGPHPQNTPRLLDILRTRNIKATFYVIGGNVDRYPHIVRRIVSEGHEIGNHTVTHGNLTKMSPDQIRTELRTSHDTIVSATGVAPRTMRPPYGAITSSQKSWIRQEFGYPSILWSVDPEDWKKPGSSVVASRLVSGARPGGILLVHDIHAPTIDAVLPALDQLLAKGFQFVTVTQLIAMDGKG